MRGREPGRTLSSPGDSGGEEEGIMSEELQAKINEVTERYKPEMSGSSGRAKRSATRRRIQAPPNL